MRSLDNTTNLQDWCVLWAQLAHELLKSLDNLHRTGEAQWGDELDAWIDVHGFEDSLGALVARLLDATHAHFKLANELLYESFASEDGEALLSTYLDELTEQACQDVWFDPAGPEGTFPTDSCGIAQVFGLGVGLASAQGAVGPWLENPDAMELLAASLKHSRHVRESHRVILLPLLLNSAIREQLDEWHIRRLRMALEDWAIACPAGHPDTEWTATLLRNLDLNPLACGRFDTLHGESTPGDGASTGLQLSYSLLAGLVIALDAPASSDAPWLDSVIFPRAEVPARVEALKELQCDLSDVKQGLSGKGKSQDCAMLADELSQAEQEEFDLRDEYGDLLTAQSASSGQETLEQAVLQALDCDPQWSAVDVLVPAQELYAAWEDLTWLHRRCSLQTMLTAACAVAQLPDANGLVGTLMPGQSHAELRVRVTNSAGDVLCVLNWPRLPGQSTYEGTAELVECLKELGVTVR